MEGIREAANNHMDGPAHGTRVAMGHQADHQAGRLAADLQEGRQADQMAFLEAGGLQEHHHQGHRAVMDTMDSLVVPGDKVGSRCPQ